MAIGPLARLLAQLVVPVVAVLARALPAAYAQALANARKSGVHAAEQTPNILRTNRISQSEALAVLNIPNETEATIENIEKQYEKYMKANAVANNAGSFYLQSKVYRAREMLVEFKSEKQQQGAE